MESISIHEMTNFISMLELKQMTKEQAAINLKKIQYYIELLDKQDQSIREITVIKAIRTNLATIKRELQTNQYSYNGNLEIITNDNICEYITQLINYQNRKDPLEIARIVYRELGKYLYYDISYVKVNTDEDKRKIVEKKIDCANTKKFTYVVCSQWSKLYCYILKKFDIKAQIRKLGVHEWVEIDLNDNYIVVADATEYLGGHIDFAACKANSRTTGFLILPKQMSGVNLRNFINFPMTESDILLRNEWLLKNKEWLFQLDVCLNYASIDGYPIDCIINNIDLFNDSRKQIPIAEASTYLHRTSEFFKRLNIPNNMDGYEVHSYYHDFLKRLPQNIAGSIGMKNLFVNISEYNPHDIHSKYLNATKEYLDYVSDIKRRFPNCLGNELFINGMALSEIIDEPILNKEQIEYEINRAMKQFIDLKYYSINQLTFYDNFNQDYHETFQLYEPLTGKIVFNNAEQLEKYKIRSHIH